MFERRRRVISHPYIPNHPPMDGHVGPKPRYPRFQIFLNHDGVRRVTDVPLKDIDIVRLAHEAAVQNLGMAQLLTHAVITTIKKDMIDEILCGPSQEPAPQCTLKTQ